MIYYQVPWSAVAAGAEVIGPDGEVWEVLNPRALGAGGNRSLAEVKRAGQPIRTVRYGDMTMVTVIVRTLDDALALLSNAFPGAQVIGRHDGSGMWTAPLELDVDGLLGHLSAFHHEHALTPTAVPSAAYQHHAILHRNADRGVSIPHAHV